MKINDLAQIFNRSFQRVFDIQKFFPIFIALIFSGLFFLFFQGMAKDISNWLKLLVLCLPFFVMVALVMTAGAMTTKVYAQQREEKVISMKEILFSSRKQIQRASYCALILFSSFLASWILLGIFISIKSIPYLGPFLGVILAFIPFLLNLCILLLFFAALLVLFFCTPLITFEEKVNKETIKARLQTDLFTHLLFIIIASLPLWIVWMFVYKALLLTFSVYSFGDYDVEKVLQSLFILIPFSAVLTFPLIFFFNLAQEAYSKPI